MGWDIHGSIEVTNNGVEWRRIIDLFFLAREYDLFGRIFGVKGVGKDSAIAFNRGVPDRPAAATLTEYLLERQRNKAIAYPSWVLASEIKGLIEQLKESDWHDSGGRPIDWSWRYALENMIILSEYFAPDRVRMVVWFDF